MISIGSRSKSNIAAKVLVEVRVQTELRKHLCRSLGVANVGVDFLLTSHFGDVGNVCWLVVDTHFVEGKVPEGFVFDCKRFVFKGVSISSAVR